MDSDLHVLCMLQNPLRWQSRYRNYWAFEREMVAGGAKLYTAEIALGDRDYVVTQADNPRHLQLRTHDELWLKENALNLLLARVPADAKYIAWIDADVKFARPDWVRETIEQLQVYKVVQMFSYGYDLDVNHEIASGPMMSFGKRYTDDFPRLDVKSEHPLSWHPGFAWAIRREVLSALGGFFDKAILGQGDQIMTFGMADWGGKMVNSWHSESYRREMIAWMVRAVEVVAGNLGFVPGALLHSWHGTSAGRKYPHRPKMLTADVYDPDIDLTRDAQGLYVLRADNFKLREISRVYNRVRREDG